MPRNGCEAFETLVQSNHTKEILLAIPKAGFSCDAENWQIGLFPADRCTLHQCPKPAIQI